MDKALIHAAEAGLSEPRVTPLSFEGWRFFVVPAARRSNIALVENKESAAKAWLKSADGRLTEIRGNCTVGRIAANDLVLLDENVSRRHAMINEREPGEFWLVDLGSSNGTYLNDRRVTQPARLNDGDRISIGDFVCTFGFAGAPTPEIDSKAGETIREVRSIPCWLLVADIEDSTQFLNTTSAEQFPQMAGRWLTSCKQAVEQHGGSMNKFLGDGFFAYWLAKEDTAELVTRAIEWLLEQQKSDGPRFRFVLHFGNVFAGGEASLGEESLMGPEVYFVFRMEKLAGNLGSGCLISAVANAALPARLGTKEYGRHKLPGFEGEHLFFTT